MITATPDDPRRNLNAMARAEFTDISYRALAELCLDTKTAAELAERSSKTESLLIDLVAVLEQYRTTTLEIALNAAVGEPWRKAYNLARAKDPWHFPLPPIEWPPAQPATGERGEPASTRPLRPASRQRAAGNPGWPSLLSFGFGDGSPPGRSAWRSRCSCGEPPATPAPSGTAGPRRVHSPQGDSRRGPFACRPHVTPRAIAEHLLDELRQRGVVGLQFDARVDVAMRRVVLAIGVEPRLDAFGPLFADVADGIGFFQSPLAFASS